MGVRADANENSLGSKPRPGTVVLQRTRSSFDTIRDLAQGDLAQGHQVGGLEEPLDGGRDLIAYVDLARSKPREQIIRRQIDQLDVVSLVEHPVGKRFALPDAGDLRDQVIEAFQVLDVDGRPDIDARIEKLFDVLPPLGMPRCGLASDEIGVRKLVDQHNGWTPRQHAIEV